MPAGEVASVDAVAGAVPAVVVSLLVIGLGWWNRRRNTQVSLREQENEANANFRPSGDKNDPVCPRCHGKGVVGWPAATCPLCAGHAHVRFGPEPWPR